MTKELPDYTKLTEEERLLQCMGELLNKWGVVPLTLALSNTCKNHGCHELFIDTCSTRC